MCGRKFQLSAHRKNEERRKQLKQNESAPPTAEIAIPHQIVTGESLTVSIPLTSYVHYWPCPFLRCTLSLIFFTVLVPFVDDSLHISSHPVQVESTTGRAGIQGRCNHQHQHQWQSRMDPTLSEAGANSINVSTTERIASEAN